MSIMIKGAEMPKGCAECPCILEEWMCGAKGLYVHNELINPFKERPNWCPLAEIPPHGRLIDADKLDRHFIYASDDNIAGMGYVDSEQEIYNEAIDDARLTVQDAPTVIESEEQEHEHE